MPNSLLIHMKQKFRVTAYNSSDTAQHIIGRVSLVPHVLPSQLDYPGIQQSSQVTVFVGVTLEALPEHREAIRQR